MKRPTKTLILLMCFAFSSCHKLLFESQMPFEANEVHQLPNSISGKYIEIYQSENFVGASKMEIKRISSTNLIIKDQHVTFLDSLELSNSKIGNVDTVLLNNNRIEIIGELDKFYKSFDDTLSSSLTLRYEIDSKNNLFYDLTEDEDVEGLSCNLRKAKGVYYLNIEYFDKHWMLIRIQENKNELTISDTNFSLTKEDKIEFDKLFQKYGFERLELLTKQSHYLAKSNDQLLNDIFNEDFFSGSTYYKIDGSKKSSKLIPIILFVLAGLILLFGTLKEKQRQTYKLK